MPLSDTACRQAKPKEKPNKLTDAGGLYLLVNATGKYWRWDYRHAQKRKTQDPMLARKETKQADAVIFEAVATHNVRRPTGPELPTHGTAPGRALPFVSRNRLMKFIAFGFWILLAAPFTVHAQCAPGIPGAGNPGCIPPTMQNSPYNQGMDAPSPPPPVWRETWGAIAIDMGVGRAGMSDTEMSKDSAISVALARCKSAGGSQCEIKTTYHNQCVALAQQKGGGDVVTFTGPDKSRAELRSVERCGGKARCAVVYSACSDAVRVQ